MTTRRRTFPGRAPTVSLVAGLLLAGALAAPPAAPAAALATPAAAAPGTRTVLVTMREQSDLGLVTGATRGLRVRHAVASLHATAELGQESLRRRLEAWRALGRVTGVRSLWITDAVSVTATPRVIKAIAARGDVASVVPDAIDLTPSETTIGANLTTLRAPAVWDQGDTGASVVVATLDTGADVTHPDLETRWRGGTNSWFDPYGQHPDAPVDLSGHGTATLGAIVGGDASGTATGVAPGARWIAARVFDDRGAASLTAVHQAFQWLLDPDGDPATPDAPQVVNASWSLGSAPGCDLSLQPDVRALVAAGILPVFAAGNYGSAPGSDVSPANYPESLAVGALVDPATALASSSRGPSICGGRTGGYPDLAAPGKDIFTTDRFGLYQVASGTSMAAPQVAGALALVLAARPGLSAERQREILTSSAVDLGPAGPDGDTGFGRVDALAAFALASASPPPPPPPPTDFALTAQPGAVSTQPGGSASFQVGVSPTSGTPGLATLTAAPPPGLTTTVAPATLPGANGTTTVTVSTTAQTTPAVYDVPVDVAADGVHHSVHVTVTVLAPQPKTLIEVSTLDATNPPGLGGSADDADVLAWDGIAFRRMVDASAAPYGLPASADVDGFSRRSSTSFYVSFADDVKVPGLGLVQDEDVLVFDGTGWHVWFDGTAHGLTSSSLDLDALSVVNGRLYFSTRGSTSLPNVAGAGDDADIYVWDGTRFGRVWDATSHGLVSSVNIDGLDVTDDTHFAVSFADTTVSLPRLGVVQDEDVVGYDSGSWRVLFDGTAAGLTGAALDVDAFDIP